MSEPATSVESSRSSRKSHCIIFLCFRTRTICCNLVLEDKETLYQEYDRLQNYTEESVKGDIENAVHEDNKNKNRYRDILPYNWRTVRIPDKEAAPGEEQNKYINASWILFKDFKQKFIASQVVQPGFNRDNM